MGQIDPKTCKSLVNDLCWFSADLMVEKTSEPTFRAHVFVWLGRLFWRFESDGLVLDLNRA